MSSPKLREDWPDGAQKWKENTAPAMVGDTQAWYQGKFRPPVECWALHYQDRVAELEKDAARVHKTNLAAIRGCGVHIAAYRLAISAMLRAHPAPWSPRSNPDGSVWLEDVHGFHIHQLDAEAGDALSQAFNAAAQFIEMTDTPASEIDDMARGLAIDCRCCERCNPSGCEGSHQGGVCDRLCSCEEDPDEDCSECRQPVWNCSCNEKGSGYEGR